MKLYKLVPALVALFAANAQAETLIKGNNFDFSIDGGNGGRNGQLVILFSTDASNSNQNFVVRNRGGSNRSYTKSNTNFSLDGGNGGQSNRQIILFSRNNNNRNQQFRNVEVNRGFTQLRKRNSAAFAIDGGNGGRNGQAVILFSQNSSNGNQQWFIR